MRHSSIIALILSSHLAGPLFAQLPDSPTGRGGNKIIELLKSGPDAVTAEWIQESFTPEFLAETSPAERQEWLSQAIERIGVLQLRGVEKTDQFAATIMGLSSNTGEKVEIRYEVADKPPHQIVLLEIDEDSGGPQRELTQDEMVKESAAYLEGLSADEFSGAALIAKGDEVLVEVAQGLASRRYDIPNTPGTRFNLGSINKLFTKIALAQLAAKGKLSFDDTVAKHLPDYPNQEIAEKITIQQVATHSAGLGDIFTDEFAAMNKERLKRASDYFQLFANDPLLFEPGTSQRYSNGGYMVLGAIIEAVSGQTYDDYVQQHIYDPAGMKATGSFAMNDPVPDLAMGYTRGMEHDHDDHHGPTPGMDAPWRENGFMIPFTGTPAGGGYSTVGDLLRFRHAFVGHELLEPRYTEWVVTNKLPDQTPEPGGFGIGVAGGAPGVNAELEMGGDYTVIVMTNLDPPSASDVARHLRGLVESVVE